MKNFIKGFGSILDILPPPNPVRQFKYKAMRPEEIDKRAWDMVGESFRLATDSIDQIIGKRPARKKNR